MDLRRTETLRPTLVSILRAMHDAPDEARPMLARAARVRDQSGDLSFWHTLMLWADHEGVLGIVGPLLHDHADVPSTVHASLERHRAVQDLWHAHLLGGLEAAVGTLADAGVQACALKGPALAARLYADPAARPSLDLDLLIDPRDVDRALTVLTGLGYSPESGPTASYLRRYGHHLHLEAAGAPPIELHFRTYAGFGIVLPADLILDRTITCDLPGGFTARVPSPEEEFLYLAVHAAGHSFAKLVWLYDLQLLVRRHPAIDWDRIFRLAHQLEIALVVAFASALLGGWFGVTIPDHPARRRPGPRSRVADWLLPAVSRPSEPSTRDTAEGLVFTALLCDRVGASAWLLQHHTLRGGRRRLHRVAPRVVPADWAG